MATEAQTPADLEFEKKSIEVNAENAKRTGVGTRQKVGRTRGKGSMVIVFEQFDESKPDTLPTSIAAFSENTGISDEPTLLSYLITGHNEKLYTDASDPLAEYVGDTWPPEAKTQFRLVVRNYAKAMAASGVTLEDAVNLIKPGFVKQFGA